MNRRILLPILAGAAMGISAACGGDDEATPVTVELSNYVVKPGVASVKAGTVKFTAINREASEVHELAVLRVNGPDNYSNLGEVEDIDPGGRGDVTLKLDRGDYLLACLIGEGEYNSKVDHFQEGMTIEFKVE